MLLAGLALGLVALVLVIFIALQNNWVRSQLLSFAESSLADAGISVEVGGLEGVLPFDFALGHLRLYDADGAWLSVEQFRLAWDPWRLLQGELRVSRLSISAVDLPRLPPSAPAEPEPDTPLELKLELPEIPQALPKIVLEQLAVDRLAFGPAIIGQAVVLGIHGQMRTLPGPEITARLSVERLDSQSLEATVQARIAGRPAKLDLTIDVEDRGELVRRLAGLPGEGPVTARLDGTGTAAVWIGELALGAGGLGQLDAGLRLGIEPEFFLETKGRVAPSMDLLPAAVAGLVGDPPEFEVSLARTGPQQMALRTLVLKLAVADLAGTARVDLAESTLESQIEVRVPDLARLSELAGQALEGGAVLTVGASGPLMQPDVQARLLSTKFAAYGASFDEAWLDAQLSLAGPLDQGYPGRACLPTLPWRLWRWTLPPASPPRHCAWKGESRRQLCLR